MQLLAAQRMILHQKVVTTLKRTMIQMQKGGITSPLSCLDNQPVGGGGVYFLDVGGQRAQRGMEVINLIITRNCFGRQVSRKRCNVGVAVWATCFWCFVFPDTTTFLVGKD